VKDLCFEMGQRAGPRDDLGRCRLREPALNGAGRTELKLNQEAIPNRPQVASSRGTTRYDVGTMIRLMNEAWSAG
jgi:hypothetical protein